MCENGYCRETKISGVNFLWVVFVCVCGEGVNIVINQPKYLFGAKNHPNSIPNRTVPKNSDCFCFSIKSQNTVILVIGSIQGHHFFKLTEMAGNSIIMAK